METQLVTLERTQDTSGRRIYSPEQRERLIAEYEASGLTQARFAKQTGVKYMTLVTWLHEKRRGEARTRTSQMKFEKLEMPRATSNAASVEAMVVVTLPDGTRIEGKRPADVAEVLRALRS